MIKLIIGGMDVSDNVSSCEFKKSEKSGGNEFTAVSGKTISNITAIVHSVSIKLIELTTDESSGLIAILNDSDIDVICDYSNYDGKYVCDGGYSISCERTDRTGTHWEISFNLLRNIPVNSDGTPADGL